MNHAQLRAFHAVAEAGGFTAAANRLGLTQPAVTLQVRALEETFRVELFHRRGRQVLLTDIGTALFGLTRRLFATEEEARELLEDAGGLARGRLRVAADGPYFVIGLIASFRARHPGIEISVAIGNSRQARQSLLDYAADVAVLATASGDARFLELPYGRKEVVLVVPAGHPWARRKSVRLGELAGQKLILREPGSSTRRAFEEALTAAGIAPEIALEIGSREAVREAVAAGLGLSVVLREEFGRDDRVRPIPFADAEIFTEEHVVCLKERQGNRAIAAFLALLEHGSPERGG
ncbi:MAG: LysR family transcriptional regulator [Alphaproteobacteria bacterium]|nr:LysR family transcriptional regulator [Alphaproteobacteria bacterium]